jgi:hypothetical protein
MDCDEILTRAADLDGRADADVDAHVARCAACADVLDAARAGRDAFATVEADDAQRPSPAADADAIWRRRRQPLRAVRFVARAAVALLAVTGAAAIANAALRPPEAPQLTRADVDDALARLSAKLDERETRRATEFRDTAVTLDDRRRNDVDVLVAQLGALRREVGLLRASVSSTEEPAMPALPDPR